MMFQFTYTHIHTEHHKTQQRTVYILPVQEISKNSHKIVIQYDGAHSINICIAWMFTTITLDI